MTRRTLFIEDAGALDVALAEWRRSPALGVDTESNSFYAYRETTCLVQVSNEDADWIVDPQKVDLGPMADLLADPAITKILHASEMDVVSLRRDYGFRIRGLFDTLVAAKAVGRRRVGLASLLEDLLGVKIAKDEQRSDWGRRPLSPSQLEYAYADTRYLLQLADKLREEVAARGPEVVEEVAVDCARMEEREARPRVFDPESFERHPSARAMEPLGRQVLRSLYAAREERAKALNKPPFRVVSDQALGEIAVRRPTSRAELGKIPGVTPPVLGRHGDALLAAVREGVELGPLPFKRRQGTPPDPAQELRFEALRKWRRKMAEARDVEVEVICGNAALRALAAVNPSSPEDLSAVAELDPWRQRRYGDQLLRVLSNPSQQP